jgi:hypothetical protein
VRRARRRLWSAVEHAEHAVRTADAAGAPVGELPLLVGRLQATAIDVDRGMPLTAARAGGATEAAVDQLIEAARRVERAATAAVEELVAPRVDALAQELSREAEALGAAVEHLQHLRHPR